MKKEFTAKIVEWHIESNKRIMPWKGEKNPYRIWLSEIILQQTRVQQGLSYYNKFVQTYPQIQDLAAASDEDVFKLWEGLGYYSRCKNLLATARQIVTEFGGQFPTSYSEILKLKGIGPYTAAAIASFAFNLPHAVVDGNVYRVLSRYFGIGLPIDCTEGKKFFEQLASECLPAAQPAVYNQAIMDFGATICTPKQPNCTLCPLQDNCSAYRLARVNELPVKVKQLVKKDRWLNYFVFSVGGYVLVNKRTDKGIWQNLYEFYLFESPSAIEWNNHIIDGWMKQHLATSGYALLGISTVYNQKLTHQNLQGQFIEVQLSQIPPGLQGLQKIKKATISQLPFPGIINQYLQNTPL